MVVIEVWAFILCTGHRWRKTKEQQPWNNTKQIFPEKKTKKSFALCHLCPVQKVLSGIWNPLISGQIVNLFGQGKSTFDCQYGNFKNYSSGNHVSTSSCKFRISGFEIIPVYLSISGNFRKWQVKNIDACRWRQARKTSIIHNLSIWIIFPSIFHQHACSLVQFIGVLARDSHGICGSYQTLLNKNEMMQSL